MTKQEAMKQLHTFICNYNLDECSNVAILTNLINEIYNDFENRVCRNCKYFRGMNIDNDIACEKLDGLKSLPEGINENNFGCVCFERKQI